MKTVLLLLLQLLLLTVLAVAQTNDTLPRKGVTIMQKPKRFLQYMHLAPTVSYLHFYYVGGFEFALVSKYNLGLSVQLQRKTINATNMPADFKPYGFSFFGEDGIPDAQTRFIHLSAIKMFQQKTKIRTAIQVGVSFIKREYPGRYVFVPAPKSFSASWFNWGDTYDYEYLTEKRVGFYVKPSMNYQLNQNFAFSITPWAVLQQKQSYYSVELGLQFGKLR